MASPSNFKKILIIDDDLNIRYVLKKLIFKHFQKSKLKIYTAAKGFEGLGLVFTIHADVIIIDSTLPRYGGLEILEYITSNVNIIKQNPKIIILYDRFKPHVHGRFSVINKQIGSHFYDKIFDAIKEKIEPEVEKKISFRERILRFMGRRAIRTSDYSDLAFERIKRTNIFPFKIFFGILWLFFQIMDSLSLAFFEIIDATKDPDNNNQQKHDDIIRFRTRYYPTMALTLAVFAIILIRLSVFLGSFFGFFNLTTTEVLAATYTWDGGGSTNNWSECANWSTNICPTSTDSVNFNSTSTKPSTIDAGFSGNITNLTVSVGYSGTITQARSLSLTGSLTQYTGSFTADSQTLSITSDLVLNSGSNFTSTSGTMTVGGSLITNTGSTFNANSGSIVMTGASYTITCNGGAFNNISLTNLNSGSKTISAGCSIPVGNNPAFNTLDLYGTLTGTGTLTVNSSFVYRPTASLTGFSGLVTGGSLNLFGTLNLSSYSPVTVGTSLTVQNAASLTAPTGNMTVGTDYVINTGGTFSSNGGTVTFTGTAISLSCNNFNFSNVVFTNLTTGAKTFGSTCIVPVGANPTFSTLDLYGTLTGTGTITTTASIIFRSTSVVSGFSGLTIGSTLNVYGSLNLSTFNPVTIGGALNVYNGGVLTAPTGNMTIGTDYAINAGGTFNSNGGTITLTGTAINLSCNNFTFSNLVFTNLSTGTKTIGSTCTVPIGNNPIFQNLDLYGTLTGTGTISTTSSLITRSGSVLTGFNAMTIGTSFTNYTVLNAGDFTSVTIGSSFNVYNGGNFTAPTGNMTIGTDFSINAGGIFNSNGGTVTFTGTSINITCNSNAFSNVVFTNLSSGSKYIAANCSVPLGNNPTFGTLDLYGTITGTGTLSTTSGMVSRSGSILSGFSGLAVGSSLGVYGTLNLSSYSPVTIGSTLTLTNGSNFTAPASMVVSGDLSFNSGSTFNANGGTVNFNGSTANLSCNNVAFNLVTFTGQTGNKTVSVNCNLPLGDNPSTPNTINLYGTLTGTNTLTIQSGTLFLQGTGATLSGFTGLQTPNLTVAGATANFSELTNFGVSGGFTISSGTFTSPTAGLNLATYSQSGGTFNASSGVTNVSSTFTLTTGTFNANGGTVNFNGGTAGLTCNNAVFNLVGFSGQTGIKTVNAGCSLPLGNNPVIPNGILLVGTLSGTGTITNTAGTLQLNSGSVLSGFNGITGTSNSLMINGATANLGGYSSITLGGDFILTAAGNFTAPATLTIGGNFTHTSGTFTHNNGTVVFNGASPTQTLTGTTAFNNLTKQAAAPGAQTLTFPASLTQTVSGALNLSGYDITNKLSLRSSSNGTQWRIDLQGARTVLYLDVKDGNNINATSVEMGGTGSTDSGNNTNFNFNSITPNNPTTLGPSNVVSGTLMGLTQPTFTFVTNDPNSLDTIKYNIQISNVSNFSTNVVDYTSGLRSQGTQGFVVGQNAGSGIYTVGAVNQTLTSGNYYWRVNATDNNGLSSGYTTANGGSIAFVLDMTPPNAFTPTLNVTSPTSNTTPTVTFSTTDNVMIDHYAVKIDSSSYITQNSPYILPTQANGLHTITVRAYDTANNHTDGSVSFTVDTSTPDPFTPTLDVTSPTNNTTPVVSFSTTDNDGIDHYEVKVDSGSFSTQTSPYQLPSLSEGLHTITVRAFDSSLNSTDGSVNITIDLTAPNIFTPNLTVTSPTNDNTPTITFTTSDANGISHYSVKIDSGAFEQHTSSYTLPVLADGSHSVTVRAFDNAGNSRDSNLLSFTVDATAPDDFIPTLNVTSPTNNTAPILTFVTSDNNAISHYQVKLDGGGFVTQTSPYQLPTLTEGDHSIIVRAFDTAGNTKDGSVNITIDTGAPEAFTISFDEVSPTNNQNPIVTYSTTDNDGIDHYEVQIDSGVFSTQTSPYILPTLSNGAHTITVRAFDLSANTTDSIGNITIDILSPNIFTPTLSPTSPTKDTTPRINFSTGDLSGINHYEVSLDSQAFTVQASPYQLGELSEGTHDATIRAFDNAGNTQDGSISFVIDTTVPVIDYSAPTLVNGTAITDTTIIVTDDVAVNRTDISATGGNISCVQTSPVRVDCTTTVSATGDLTIYAADDAINTASVVISGYVIDQTVPVINITAPTKSRSVAITDTTIQVTDNYRINASGVHATGGTISCSQTTVAQVDCTVTIPSSGSLAVTAADRAGNNANKTEAGYVVSGVPPANFTPVLNTGIYTNNTTPTVSFVTADDDGIDHYEVEIDYGAFVTQTSPYILPIQTEGPHLVRVRAYDPLGNFTDGVTSFIVDVTRPADFSAYMVESSPTSNIRPTVIFSTTDNYGLSHYEVGVDDGLFTIESNPNTLPILSSGEHTVTVRAVDRADNVTISTTSITVDTSGPAAFAPTLDVTSPTNNSTPNLSFFTTDDVGIDHYEVQIDSGSFSTQASPYQIPTLSDGDHTFTVRAFDGAGNSIDGSIGLTVDTIAPIDFTVLMNVNSPTNDQTPVITFLTTDNTGLDHYDVSVDGSIFETEVSPYELNPLAEGSHTITVRAYDAGGNYSEGSRDLIVDITPPNAFTPILNVVSPTNNSSPIVSFLTTDNVAISHYEVQIDSGSFTTQSSPYTIPELTSDNHLITVAAFDTAGNTRNESANLYVDSSAPVIIYNVPTLVSKNIINDTSINVSDNSGINVNDVTASGGVLNCVQTSATQIDCTAIINISGDLTINALDSAGNSSSNTITGYVIDNENPLITITAPTKTLNNTIVDTGIDVSDNYAINAASVTATGGIISCLQSASNHVTCSVSISNSGDLIVNVTDLAGNASSKSELGYVITADSPLPDPFIPTLDTGSFTTNRTPTVSFVTTAPDGINHYEVKLDNGVFTTQTSPFKLPELTDGFHSIVVRAISNGGKFRDAAVSVTIDVTPPNVFILIINVTSPTNNRRPTVQFSAQDNNGIDHYEVKVASEGGEFAVQQSPYQTEELEEGDHIITARAFDRAGNTTDAATDLTLDITPPTGSNIINNNDERTDFKKVNLKIQAVDSKSGISEMIIAENESFVAAKFEPYSETKEWILSDGGGDKTIYIKFKDNAGNESLTYTDSIYLNAPIIVPISEEVIPVEQPAALTPIEVIKAIEPALPVAAVTGTVLIAAVNLSTYPQFIAYGFFIIRRKQKNKVLGVVYDLDLMTPIAFATLRIYEKQSLRLVVDAVSDVEGKYGFVLSKGDYFLEVLHSDYKKYREEFSFTEIEGNFGKDVGLSKSGTEQPLNRRIKAKLLRINTVLVLIGFLISLIALIIVQNVVNLLVVILYLSQFSLLFIFRKKSRRDFGYVYDSSTNQRVKGAFVRLYNLTTERQIDVVLISDKDGRYIFKPIEGEYLIKVDCAGYKFPSKDQLEEYVYTTQNGEVYLKVKVEKNKPINLIIPLDPVGERYTGFTS